jgi:type III restriction enzyme
MPRVRSTPSQVTSLALPEKIADEVIAWRSQGYHPFPSPTTHTLLRHWFDREHDEGGQFHDCQRVAIETIIYLHELRGVRAPRQLYEQFAPDRLNLFKSIADEVNPIPFGKYCIKAATGSGKTWVLTALVVWQYFNAINQEANAPYSARFMVVTPGLEVRNRILDSFKGRRDPRTGSRDPSKADYKLPLFMPQDATWRDRFHLEILEPDDVRSNAQPPDGPFLAVTNWQQFALAKEEVSLAEQMGLEIPDAPQGEIVADFMTTFPDLVVLNDEAHHVHGKKSARAEELVWRRFMGVLHARMREKHGKAAGLFLQLDFSATPFYGSGPRREYFPHIVADYDLRDALNDMLVKQLFLEERTEAGGKRPKSDLDFRADRDPDRQVIKLSFDQKQIVDIGVAKLNQLTNDFVSKGLNRKPVLMILCEDTVVADLVHEHLHTVKGPSGDPFSARDLLVFHSNLKKEKHGYTMEDARRRTGPDTPAHATLDDIDDDNDALRVVISVLALREGFDKTNICVTAVLRATEADMLLEQIVGRGLRLMFPRYKYPELWEAKRQAFEDLKSRRKPENSLDFLYIVEHPRFRTFYDDLRKQGYLIASGDSSDTTATGDVVPVDAAPNRVPQFDVAWPLAVQEEGKLPDLTQIDVDSLPSSAFDIDQLRHVMSTLSITDRHLESDTRADTWQLRNRFFDYDDYLRDTVKAIVEKGDRRWLTAKRAEIAALVDDYTTRRLFKREIDFGDPENYKVLGYGKVRDHVVETIRNTIVELLGTPSYEIRGTWKRLSDLPRVFVRGSNSLPTQQCIYPRMPVASRYGGFERKLMETTLDATPGVAWCKLQRKHGLTIAYRDPSGLLRNYEVDFIARTADGCFLIETKATKDLSSPTVATKARAAKHWCESVSGVAGSPVPGQPSKWEYLLLDEETYAANEGASFEALAPLMRQLRDQVIAEQFKGELFG